ncbi:MAG: hypothetical protein IID08_08885 [Candidatus Hydrogenedentes bacterium]|nr:hypothetical protein [Candidatus Hydrogenedentota bacterium]
MKYVWAAYMGHRVHCVLLMFAVFLVAPSATGEKILVVVDSTYPSGGSGYEGPRPAPTMVEIEAPDVSAFAPLQSSVAAEAPGGPSTPTASLTFDGTRQSPGFKGGSISKPPDTHIAVGTGAGVAGRVIMVTNTGIQIWDKSANVIFVGDDLDAFVVAAGGTLDLGGAFDPKIIFDQDSGRFFVVMLDGKSPAISTVHVLVSTNSTPNSISAVDWTPFKATAVTDFGGTSTWFDYPGIGADSTRLVVTGNMFDVGGTFRGAKIRVFDKAALLVGMNNFADFNIDKTVTSGASTLQPAHVYGTTDSGNFYLVNRFGPAFYRLWEIGGTPASPVLVAGTATTYPWVAGDQLAATFAPQMGVTGIELDTLSARIMQAAYRNGSIWCALSADADADAKTEVVWFEIRTNGGSPTVPTVRQFGFIDGSDGDEWAFMPSINVNAAGDVMINYSQSFTDQFVDMRAVFRLQADPLNTFQSSVLIHSSVGEYDDFGSSNPERWGDYSATVVDPDDDTTFWIANEYCIVGRAAGDDAEWGTRIAKMNLPAATLPAATGAVRLMTALSLLVVAVAVLTLRARRENHSE